MATKSFRSVLEQVREQAAGRAVQSDLSVLLRGIDLQSRRTVEALEAPRLADLVLAAREIKKRLPDVRQKAASTDPRDRDAAATARYVLGEVEALDAEISKSMKIYVQRSGDSTVYSKGFEAWARGVMKQHHAELADDEKRRQARAAAPVKPSAKPMRKRAAVLSVRRLTTKSSGGGPQVALTASSEAVDLDGDRFSVKALEQMRDGLLGKTTWIGHKYDPSTDVFGVVSGSSIVQRSGRSQLDLVIEVATKSERAMKVYELIKSGVRIGASVGVMVLEHLPDEHAKGITILNSVRPLEISVVGIPANFDDAWVRSAKSKGFTLDNLVV